MKPLFTIVLIAVVAGGGWLLYRQGMLPFVSPPTEPPAGENDPDSKTARPRSVVALARLEPAGGVIDVGAIAGQRLEVLEVAEGETVDAGALLARLDSHTLRQFELGAIESQLTEAIARATAETALADARIRTANLAVDRASSAQTEIDALHAKIELIEKTIELDLKTAQRMEALPEDLVSIQEHEQQSLLIQRNRASLKAAQAELAQAEQERKFALASAQAELKAAEAGKKQVLSSIPIKSIEQQRDLSREQLNRTEIRSPSPGTVLEIHSQVGELLGTRPLLQLADLTNMVAVAEVYENDVKHLSEGQTATIKSKAFPAPYDTDGLSGKIVAIGRTIGSAHLQSVDPFAPTDRHVVEVRVQLDDAGSRVASQFVNLQVDAVFPPE